MEPTVSIIVPVYNAEKFIQRCVDSILHQEFTDFELLLINDGSTDLSGSICDEYASLDPRVHVFHKENTGVSDTRNYALDRARGAYLQFADSDDWIAPDATKLFVRAAKKHDCDLVIADFYRVVGKRISHKGDIEEENVLTREAYAAHMMANPADFYYGVLWNKLYRKDIVEKHHLRMDAALSWCEDFLFNLEYILHSKSFYALQAPVYYYVKTEGSLVSQSMSLSKSIKMKLLMFDYYNKFYKHILDEKEYEKNRLQVYSFLVKAATDGLVPLLPGSKKLGDERTGIFSGAVDRDGIIMDAYRDRKLLERYMETIALKNDLTLNDVKVLFYLSQSGEFQSLKELSDFVNLSRRTLSMCLQRLTAKGYIRMEEIGERKTGRQKILFLPACDGILADFDTAQNDYDQVRFQGFTEEELIRYAFFNDRIKENIRRVL
nr:glycosyltransferase [uncultured Acetatifactor sp.]